MTGYEKKLGFIPTFIISFFFTPFIGIICTFISGANNDPLEKALIEKLDKILEEIKSANQPSENPFTHSIKNKYFKVAKDIREPVA
jgi:hypothetical protein